VKKLCMTNVKRLKLGFQLNFARENGLVKIQFFYPVERLSENLEIKAGERSFSDNPLARVRLSLGMRILCFVAVSGQLSGNSTQSNASDQKRTNKVQQDL
jgi:hypothetical protein